MYTSSFAITLVALTMITTLVILAITSNIILSLGMVGALSIVRFRTAVKEPMDIAFLFWSIAVGIVLAAGLIPLAVFGSLWIGIILYIFSHKKNTQRPYILVVHCENQNSEKNVYQFIQKQVYAFSLKSNMENPLVDVDVSSLFRFYETKEQQRQEALQAEADARPLGGTELHGDIVETGILGIQLLHPIAEIGVLQRNAAIKDERQRVYGRIRRRICKVYLKLVPQGVGHASHTLAISRSLVCQLSVTIPCVRRICIVLSHRCPG